MLLVIRRVTGPMEIDMDIILPVILARDLALIWVFWEAGLSVNTTCPLVPRSGKSISNPSHFSFRVGSQIHLAECSTKPALIKSSA